MKKDSNSPCKGSVENWLRPYECGGFSLLDTLVGIGSDLVGVTLNFFFVLCLERQIVVIRFRSGSRRRLVGSLFFISERPGLSQGFRSVVESLSTANLVEDTHVVGGVGLSRCCNDRQADKQTDGD